MANVHKGWLKTRDKEYFSPNILAESIYTRDGGKYDDAVKGYIQEAKTEFQTTQIDVQNKINDLYNKLKNIDGSDADTFYITDTNGNIILKVDAEGGHSIDFKSLSYSLEEIGDTLDNIDINDNGIIIAEDLKNKNGDSFNQVRNELTILQTDFIDKFKNLDTSDSNVLYITDNNGNIIVRIDEDGITSINYNVPNLISYVELVELVNNNYNELNEKINLTEELLQGNIEEVQTNLDTFIIDTDNRLKNFDGEDSNTLYITDNNGNIIVKIDDTGITSINFNTGETDLNNISADLITEIDTRTKEVAALKQKDSDQQIEIESNATDILDIYNKIKYFSNDGSKFLVIDSNNQVLMEVTIDGITTNNVITSKYNINIILEQLITNLDKEIQDRENAINNLANHVNSSIDTLQKNIDNRLKNFDGEDSDILYITDSNGNIITRIDSTGVHSVNFTTTQYDINNMLSNLDTRLIKEISNRAAEDLKVKEFVNDTAQTLQVNINNVDNKVNILIDIDENKSVRTIANEELATQLIPETAKESLDTLQEIAAWIQAHPDDASAMNEDIQILQKQLGGFEETTNVVKDYIDTSINTLSNDINLKLKNFDGSDSNILYITDSNGNKIAQIDENGVTSINFISNKYNINNEFASLDERIKEEIALRAEKDEEYYNKHADELRTYKVEAEQMHNTLQTNIDDTKNELLDKIKFYENESIDGSDTLYIVDGNGYKMAQFDETGLWITDVRAANGLALSNSMFYSIDGYKEINI